MNKSIYIKYCYYIIQSIELKIKNNDGDIGELERMNRYITNTFLPMIENFEHDNSLIADYHMIQIIENLYEVVENEHLKHLYRLSEEVEWYTIYRQQKINNVLND